MGDEPDADQRLDPAVPALGSPARRRCRLDQGRRHLQVGGVAQVRGAVEREAQGLAGLSSLDLLAIQIDGLLIHEDLILVAAVGIDATGEKHPLGRVEGATENAATVQALLDNLVERGLDPAVVRLFIIDGAKALSKAIRRTFGRNTLILSRDNQGVAATQGNSLVAMPPN